MADFNDRKPSYSNQNCICDTVILNMVGWLLLKFRQFWEYVTRFSSVDH